MSQVKEVASQSSKIKSLVNKTKTMCRMSHRHLWTVNNVSDPIVEILSITMTFSFQAFLCELSISHWRVICNHHDNSCGQEGKMRNELYSQQYCKLPHLLGHTLECGFSQFGHFVTRTLTLFEQLFSLIPVRKIWNGLGFGTMCDNIISVYHLTMKLPI